MGRDSAAVRSLRRAGAETSAYLSSIANASEQLSQRSNDTLIGALGAVSGGIGGYALDIGMHLAAPLMPITFGSAAGLLLTLILWRGPQRIWKERARRADERELAHRIEFSRAQLKKLGRNGPPGLVHALESYPMTGVTVAQPPAPISLPAPSIDESAGRTTLSQGVIGPIDVPDPL